MRTLAIDFNVTVICGPKDSTQFKALLECGWEYDHTYTYHTVPLGKIEFQVLVRFTHFNPAATAPTMLATVERR